MSLRAKLSALWPFNDSEQEDGLDVLADLLAQREATLALDATYQKPTVSQTGEPTAVFPIYLETEDGEPYGLHAKEFPLPDDGLEEDDADLTQFVADAHGIDAEDAVFADLAAVAGLEAEARLGEDGELTVDVPSGAANINDN